MSTLSASDQRVEACAENLLNDFSVVRRLVSRNEYVSSLKLRIVEDLRTNFEELAVACAHNFRRDAHQSCILVAFVIDKIVDVESCCFYVSL